LDPSIFGDTSSGIFIQELFSALVEYGVELTITPDVAQRWEIFEDGRRYVFHLRDDVTWSDGTQVTAADFEYSWKHSLDPATGAPLMKVGLLYDLKNARAYNLGDIPDSDPVGVRAIDRLTLEVEMEEPASYFLYAASTLYPIPKHIVEKFGESWTAAENIVTNGAFRMESYVPKQTLVLVRDPTYHGPFPGNLERVESQLMESIGSLDELELYKNDSIDYANLGSATFHARYRYADEYVKRNLPRVHSVHFDTTRPPFDDARVRRAFAMAIDREWIANQVLEGFGDPTTGGFVPPSVPGHSPGIGLPYDPAQARQLLAEAGYPEGRGFMELDLTFRDLFRNVLEYLSSQWKEILNVEVKVRITDWETVLRTAQSKSISFMGWIADYPDPDSFLSVAVRAQVPWWQHDPYDQLLKEAQRTLDHAERIRLYQEADKILVEEAVVIPITNYPGHWLNKPWVSSPSWGYIQGSWFKNITLKPH
jgi:oligopeptide transport system substrate-binding protein